MSDSTIRNCPVCSGAEPSISVSRAAIPVFQNVVYPTRAAALAAPQAPFALGTCAACGFSYNAVFAPERVVYDESYDNFVASPLFKSYYRGLAVMLIERLNLTSGTVYDVGCGNGEFLRILCQMAPGICGIGIDPSCTPTREGNFELIRARFDASTFGGDARLVILRHVLEHIDEPVAFLKALRDAMPDAPLFVEVPDLDWILGNGAFWDFCYEHCNYFTLDSLAHALSLASFEMIEQRRSFGDQYQWALCRPADDVRPTVTAPDRALAAVDGYAIDERARLRDMRARASDSGGLVLWGMATKGVLLSTLLGEKLVRGGIDMNEAKQGRFVPGSGVEIHAPDWLTTLADDPAVLVMNPNYVDEIVAIARTFNVESSIAAV